MKVFVPVLRQFIKSLKQEGFTEASVLKKELNDFLAFWLGYRPLKAIKEGEFVVSPYKAQRITFNVFINKRGVDGISYNTTEKPLVVRTTISEFYSGGVLPPIPTPVFSKYTGTYETVDYSKAIMEKTWDAYTKGLEAKETKIVQLKWRDETKTYTLGEDIKKEWLES